MRCLMLVISVSCAIPLAHCVHHKLTLFIPRDTVVQQQQYKLGRAAVKNRKSANISLCGFILVTPWSERNSISISSMSCMYGKIDNKIDFDILCKHKIKYENKKIINKVQKKRDI